MLVQATSRIKIVSYNPWRCSSAILGLRKFEARTSENDTTEITEGEELDVKGIALSLIALHLFSSK